MILIAALYKFLFDGELFKYTAFSVYNQLLVSMCGSPLSGIVFKSWLAGGAVSALTAEHIDVNQRPLVTGSGKVSQWKCS